jgi:hypothetical protein
VTGRLPIVTAALSRAGVWAIALVIRAYQLLVSPLLGANCRFTPTCSHYALEALREHGVWRGLGLAAWRILRCNPFGGSGYDPVPPSRRTIRPASSLAAPGAGDSLPQTRQTTSRAGGGIP